MSKILITLNLLLLLLTYGCTQSDGSFCADVKRYNPKTMKESAYTLVVDVEDQRLIRIYWPNGGYIDSGEFDPPSITNGGATFSDHKNVQYSVRLLKPGKDCFEGALEQCEGLTKKGQRCKNKTDHTSGRCHYHR